MNTVWSKATAGAALGVMLGITLSVTLTVLLIFGWKTEQEITNTELSFKADLNFKRETERRVREGGASSEETPSVITEVPASPEREATTVKPASNVTPPYVGGNYVSGRSNIRYVLDDKQGHIEIYGYDIMRDRRVSVGSGRMVGRRLIIPKFYSFLDDTYGTLKLDLSEDGKTLEGRFEGLNAAEEARVVLMRMP